MGRKTRKTRKTRREGGGHHAGPGWARPPAVRDTNMAVTGAEGEQGRAMRVEL